MSQADPSTIGQQLTHWTVKSNYRLRVASFITLFVSIFLHGRDKDYSPFFWGLIALQLLVYPHFAYWLARRSSDSQQAEVRNLTVDCLMFGMLVAALQFPLWIVYTVYIASTLNITLSRGKSGLVRSQLAFFGGVLVAVAFFGWHVSPNTEWPATAVCLIASSVYMISIGIAASSRNHQLRDTREALRHGEHALKIQLAENQALQSTLEEQATIDPLTGLYNRRYLDTAIARELARCKREKLPLALIMIDVDHFKKVNDTYGHPGGDEVLKKLAALLLESIRATDVACRYGGEEFLLLLPGMSPEMAAARADKWRMAFAELIVRLDDLPMQATISLGISNYPQHGDSLTELAHCADLALYRAKNDGRNRVVVYRPELEVADIVPQK